MVRTYNSHHGSFLDFFSIAVFDKSFVLYAHWYSCSLGFLNSLLGKEDEEDNESLEWLY
jgi:hypothetical protein